MHCNTITEHLGRGTNYIFLLLDDTKYTTIHLTELSFLILSNTMIGEYCRGVARWFSKDGPKFDIRDHKNIIFVYNINVTYVCTNMFSLKKVLNFYYVFSKLWAIVNETFQNFKSPHLILLFKSYWKTYT